MGVGLAQLGRFTTNSPARSGNFHCFEEGVSMSDWRELYKAAVLENKSANIEQRITETEVALLVRLFELGTSSEAGDERREIEVAARALVTLKQHAA